MLFFLRKLTCDRYGIIGCRVSSSGIQNYVENRFKGFFNLFEKLINKNCFDVLTALADFCLKMLLLLKNGKFSFEVILYFLRHVIISFQFFEPVNLKPNLIKFCIPKLETPQPILP